MSHWSSSEAAPAPRPPTSPPVSPDPLASWTLRCRSRSQSPGVLAGALLLDVQELAESADIEDLTYIAWRTTKLANDLCFLASAAGAAQRRRLAGHMEVD